MRIVVLPVESDQSEEEVTAMLVVALAEEIWRLCRRQGDLDWLAVERVLADMAAAVRTDAAEAQFVNAAAARPVEPGAGRGSQMQRGWQQPQVAAAGVR